MDKTIIEKTPKFTESTLKNLEKLIPLYDSDEDMFFLIPENPVPAISYDWEGEIWIRFDPTTREVLGLEIENFEAVFLIKYPEVAKVWKAVKPFCTRKKTRVKEDENICESFIRVLLSFFDDLTKNTPQQTSFDIA